MRSTFDGIWACASLLHVPAKDFPRVARQLIVALKAGGVWFLSFKHGQGEHIRRGRLFVDHTEHSLQSIIDGLADVRDVET